MTLPLEHFYYYQTLSRFMHDVRTWHNVVLSNVFLEKFLLKVEGDGLMEKELVSKNMAVFAIFFFFFCSLRKPRK